MQILLDWKDMHNTGTYIIRVLHIPDDEQPRYKKPMHGRNKNRPSSRNGKCRVYRIKDER